MDLTEPGHKRGHTGICRYGRRLATDPEEIHIKEEKSKEVGEWSAYRDRR